MVSNRVTALAESDLDAYVEIMAVAYPGLKIVSDADRQRLRDRLASTFEDPTTTIYGLSQDGRLIAGMILYDFTMNVRGTMLPAGGLGSLAVDLLHRKRKAAKTMVTYYLEHYRRRGFALGLLYPFRTDFYRRMGFGYGTKMNRYVFRPQHLRVHNPRREHIEYLGSRDVGSVLDCFDRYASSTHGMILGSRWRVKRMLSNMATRTAGYVKGGQVLGYITFDFENQGHFLQNDLQIKQLIYRDAEVLQELVAFMQSLADQFDWIVFDTHDNYFHHLLNDPRNRADALIPSVYHESNTQGVGLMYRVVDPELLFGRVTDIRFGLQRLTLKITLNDSFMPDNDGDLFVRFESGRASLQEVSQYDAAIQMGVGDFSSMIMGAINLEQLIAYGLAHVSDLGLIKKISDLFTTDLEPVCMTAF